MPGRQQQGRPAASVWLMPMCAVIICLHPSPLGSPDVCDSLQLSQSYVNTALSAPVPDGGLKSLQRPQTTWDLSVRPHCAAHHRIVPCLLLMLLNLQVKSLLNISFSGSCARHLQSQHSSMIRQHDHDFEPWLGNLARLFCFGI